MQPEEKYKQIYNPKSNRLQNYDYGSNGGYFITICTKNRENYFGEIIDGKMILNEIGKIAEKYYLEITKHFPFVILDEFVIMPNHIHGIIIIDKSGFVETRQCLVSTDNENKINRFQNQGKGTISSIIGSFKSIYTKTIKKIQNKIFFAWQPNYYDRIIRNEEELQKIRKYILENPLKWELDKNNAENLFM
ncbi:MAG: transposase [Candidatus Gracilibacteria bacterium]|nr:transposase [Candidatus Gracilibacteria bacterium]